MGTVTEIDKSCGDFEHILINYNLYVEVTV